MWTLDHHTQHHTVQRGASCPHSPEFTQKRSYWHLAWPIADHNDYSHGPITAAVPSRLTQGDTKLGAFQHLGAVRWTRANWPPTVRGKKHRHTMPVSAVTLTRHYSNSTHKTYVWIPLMARYQRPVALWYSDGTATLKCLKNSQSAHGLVYAAETCWCRLHTSETQEGTERNDASSDGWWHNLGLTQLAGYSQD